MAYKAADLDRIAAQRENPGRVVQWVVVTAWRGEDGSHMVLTTASLPASLSDRTGQPVAAGKSTPAGDEAGSPGVGQSEDFHPYAAVPVRGGWLVFQL